MARPLFLMPTGTMHLMNLRVIRPRANNSFRARDGVFAPSVMTGNKRLTRLFPGEWPTSRVLPRRGLKSNYDGGQFWGGASSLDFGKPWRGRGDGHY
jgi:hypothetical protein